jgi:ATP-dependent helicase HrpB
VLDAADPLAGARLIVATDLDGDPREARIRQAAELAEADLRALYADRIRWRETCAWNPREGRIEARRQETFGALLLDDRAWDAPPEARARAALDGVRALGLAACGMTEAAARFCARVEFLRAQGEDLPEMTEPALMARAEDWLLPHLAGCRTAADLSRLDLLTLLRNGLTWEERERLDRLAPAGWTTPLGREVPIDYAGGVPTVELRLQEVFGVTVHPAVGPRRLPLRLTLLSPARRPVAVTTDLPGFWSGAYADVRKAMRGQYPKHPWPEDPAAADPTLRAKPRGS